ncbi:hypothetical protein EV368DRAFT_63906 [Lentinula lateritia]|uniref:Uncharacterized protein n=1 Tax=Lentinula aff. lateritia TaxID=2804960 RepID=A0ACC1U3X6_9AGAR|nr:hypothetical protein F5876DRAFT_64585 [Lentinula aff. lateritia]KAJ3853680.1 hypothetical protein EV368DRAFT_63906 [Lentinula lateritia]
MRVSLNILLLLAISLPLLSRTSLALPISGDPTIEIRTESCPKSPQRQPSMKDRVKAKTLKATTISVGEGAVLTPFVDQWYESHACAVYANKKKFENAHKVITGSVSRILQKANQELHQTGDPFTKETTILFHRMMLIPPHYLEPPDGNGRGDLGISIKCVSATESNFIMVDIGVDVYNDFVITSRLLRSTHNPVREWAAKSKLGVNANLERTAPEGGRRRCWLRNSAQPHLNVETEH